MKTERLTVAQAIVKFLAAQYTELDGVEHRLIAGMWGIQGHGNVPGLGQAMQEYGLKKRYAFLPPPKRAGAGSYGGCLCTAHESAEYLCVYGVRWTWQ